MVNMLYVDTHRTVLTKIKHVFTGQVTWEVEEKVRCFMQRNSYNISTISLLTTNENSVTNITIVSSSLKMAMPS
jgi:hypothetical protein